MDPWSANLDLSLNLWLCADGIDIIEDLEVTPPLEDNPPMPLEPDQAARFAAVWMDTMFQPRFFQAYSSQMTRLDWETKVAKAMQDETFPLDLTKRCRSFEWYAMEVNTDLSKVLEKGAWEHDHEKDLADKRSAFKAAVKPQEGSKEDEQQDQDNNEPSPDAAEDEAEDEAIPDLAQHDKQKPAEPLRAENLDIVQNAKPISIAFVDVSGGHKDHPHLGATFENGTLGYIHDETALHRNPPPFEYDDEKMKKACTLRDNNYRMMHERVFVDMDYDKKMEESGTKRDKIFCLVYTIDSGHPKIPGIRQTWG
jgi:hypothetical protein